MRKNSETDSTKHGLHPGVGHWSEEAGEASASDPGLVSQNWESKVGAAPCHPTEQSLTGPITLLAVPTFHLCVGLMETWSKHCCHSGHLGANWFSAPGSSQDSLEVKKGSGFSGSHWSCFRDSCRSPQFLPQRGLIFLSCPLACLWPAGAWSLWQGWEC
jgi:hypothetical protein